MRGGPWSTPAVMWYAPVARGDFCRKTFPIGTTSTRPFDAGVLKAGLKQCMTACGKCGESARRGTKCPVAPYWMRKARAVRRRAERPVYDAGKKVKGRKRNLVVDTLGLLLAVSVNAANLQDRDAGSDAVARAVEKYPSVQRLYVDSAYAGQWAATTEAQHGLTVEVVRHPANRNVGRWVNAGQQDLFPEALTTGFTVLPKRWVVERTHAWNECARRLVMHHDRLTKVSEAWVWLAEARMLACRLTPGNLICLHPSARNHRLGGRSVRRFSSDNPWRRWSLWHRKYPGVPAAWEWR